MASHHPHHHSAGRIARQALSVMALERGDIAALTVYSVIVGILSLVLPLAAQALFANVAFGTLLQPVLILSLIVVSLLAFSGVLSLIEHVVVERLQRRYFARISMAFADALTVGHGILSDRSAGIDRANRFFEVLNIQKTIAKLLLDGLALALQMLVGLALLAVYHPLLLAFDVCLILGLSLITTLWGRRAIETAVDESKAKLHVANWLHELAASPVTFQSASGRSLAFRRADELTESYLDRRRSHFRVLLRQIAGSVLLQVLANGSVLAIGGWLVIVGQLTLGQLVAAEIVVSSVAAGIGKLGMYLEAFYDLSASTDKVAHVLATEGQPESGRETPPTDRPDQLLRFKSVRDPVLGLHDVDWNVDSGNIVGVHHPVGFDARPLVELLTGTRTQAGGHLELLGIDYRELDRAQILECVALVNRCEVFPGTVYDNVGLGPSRIDKEVVREALGLAGILEAMLALPEGLQTRLEEYGHFLPPGQRPRLMLARALAHRCPLIIVEKLPTAMSSAEVIEMLNGLREHLRVNKSSIILFTDQVELLRACDQTRVIGGGQIEPGSIAT